MRANLVSKLDERQPMPHGSGSDPHNLSGELDKSGHLSEAIGRNAINKYRQGGANPEIWICDGGGCDSAAPSRLVRHPTLAGSEFSAE